MRSRSFFAFIILVLFAFNLSMVPVMGQSAEPMYDLVIRNGRVFDGAGNPWILADVAIKDGKFVRIGRVEGKGKREIDASGRYVSPGWIDMLDQSGGVLPRNEIGRAS